MTTFLSLKQGNEVGSRENSRPTRKERGRTRGRSSQRAIDDIDGESKKTGQATKIALDPRLTKRVVASSTSTSAMASIIDEKHKELKKEKDLLGIKVKGKSQPRKRHCTNAIGRNNYADSLYIHTYIQTDIDAYRQV
jgi:hypothetical protein